MKWEKSFLKWAGGKYRYLDAILPHLHGGYRLLEPFVGSSVIFLNTSYETHILADQNQDLIELYKLLKNHGHCFIRDCAKLFTPENNCNEKYYQLRSEFNQTVYGYKRAALFLYLNRHGYNGLCRYNQKGIYNVPFGRYSKPYFPEQEMLNFFQKSQSTDIISGDFRQTFSMAEKGDVIYCDPPYIPLSHTSKFTSYTENDFLEDDQIALAQLAIDAANRGIKVVISNHDNEFTRHHYQHASIYSFPVQRFISCQPDKRRTIQELVAVFGE